MSSDANKLLVSLESLDEANARVLAELVVDSTTSPDLQVKIIAKLLDRTEHDNFFRTIFVENLSYASCPKCKHENHWLVPEEALNEMGFLSHSKDPRVPLNTDQNTCKKYQQACKKKKITI